MSDNHGNTPAAWTFVSVAMLGFVVGAAGMLFDPINWTIFWVGVGLGIASLVIFFVMAKLGYHEEASH
jgi:cyanate permease